MILTTQLTFHDNCKHSECKNGLFVALKPSVKHGVHVSGRDSECLSVYSFVFFTGFEFRAQTCEGY